MAAGERGSVPRWSEADSHVFSEYASVFVPGREEQVDVLCALVALTPSPVLMVDVGCGDGALSEAVLERVQGSTVLALDGSRTMVELARERLDRYGSRVECRHFELADDGWRGLPAPASAVVSSLTVHHLDSAQKRELFRDALGMLRPGGAFLVADLVLPVSAAGRRLAAEAWEREVRTRSLTLTGDLAAHARFVDDGWNLFALDEGDPVDKPDTLVDQLRWLEAAGFDGVDAFWMRAGHAVYGGYRPYSPGSDGTGG